MTHQHQLPLDAEQLFYLQHGRHRDAISTAMVNGEQWTESRPHIHSKAPDAIRAAADASRVLNADAYVGQNGISMANVPYLHRLRDEINSLTCLWVDLDYYQTEHRDLSPEQLLELIKQDLPWLPYPTTITDSGRGCYLHWVFHDPIDQNDIASWQRTMDGLTAVLAPYGADIMAKDATRVLRIVGSLHCKTSHIVKAWDTGPGYHWYKLRDVISQNYWKKVVQKARDNNSPIGTISWIKNGHTRMHRALVDIKTLAQIRSPVVECRHRILMCAAMVGSWYCPSNESMLRELSTITTHFAKHHKNRYAPERLPRLLTTIMKKADEGRAGLVIERGPWQGKDKRYTPSIGYLVEVCEITRAEQRQMSYLIDSAERLIRERRKKGVKPQADHLKKARVQASEAKKSKKDGQREQAIKLRESGLTNKEIAAELGVGLRTVIRYCNS